MLFSYFMLLCGSLIMYHYRRVIICLLRFVNYLYDKYLDRKYVNYHCQIEPKEYHITKINSITGKTIFDFGSIYNLRNGFFQLVVDHNTNQVIYVYFVYGEDEYILPIRVPPDGIIELPPYSPEDIDTCMKVEYDHVGTRNDRDQPIIYQFAGPKGNFYCDTKYQFCPALIRNASGQLLLVDENDYLTVTPQMGEEITFQQNQKIIVP